MEKENNLSSESNKGVEKVERAFEDIRALKQERYLLMLKVYDNLPPDVRANLIFRLSKLKEISVEAINREVLARAAEVLSGKRKLPTDRTGANGREISVPSGGLGRRTRR